MRTFLIRSMLVVLLPLGLVGATSLADEKLPTDPALMMSTLPNGLTYIIRPHRNPEGRVSIWLHVASGSLNETDSTRGLAHYLEHMAFNGSANFAPGSVVPFFHHAPSITLRSDGSSSSHVTLRVLANRRRGPSTPRPSNGCPLILVSRAATPDTGVLLR